MEINFNGTCSSHAPILLEYLRVFRPKTTVEFGSGFFSTQMLLNSGAFVYSFEISSMEWYDFLKDKLWKPNWMYFYKSNIDDIKEIINNIIVPIDLAFVDDGDSRAPLTNFMFNKVATIIAHDTQYEWARDFTVPENYMRIDFKNTPHYYESPEHRPYTTLITKDKTVFDYFSQTDELSLYEKYKFPYGIER